MANPTNPYEPVLHGSRPPFWEWQLAAVSVVFVAYVAMALSTYLMIWFPVTSGAIRPRIDFGVLFLSPVSQVAIWYWRRDDYSLWGASFVGIWASLTNAYQLFKKGTVAVVENEFLDSLHSAWFWSVLLPLLLACALAFIAYTYRLRRARLAVEPPACAGSED